jgi:hypothetical protein
MATQLKMVDGQVVIVPSFEEDDIQIIDPRETRGMEVGDMGGRKSMGPDTRERIMSTPVGGVAGLLGRLRGASESEGIYDEGKGGNWFEEMFLKRTGGGGQDYMIPAEAKERDFTEIMTIGPRDDVKAKKIEAERMGFFKIFLGKLNNLLDESSGDEEKMKKFREIQLLQVELARDLRNGTNETGLNPKKYRDATPNETAANVVMKRFNLNQGGRVGYQDGTKLDEILKEDTTISDSPNDPRNMSTERIVGLIKSGRSTPEMFIELMKRGYDVSGGVTELDLSEMGENFKKGDVGYTFDESKIKEGGAIEDLLFKLREKNPDIYGKYERPMKNYPVGPFFAAPPPDDLALKKENRAIGGRVGYQTGGITETRNLPPEYVEALGKTYAADLTRQAGIPSITTATTQQPGETAEQFAQRQAQAQQFQITKAGMADLAPTVAPESQLQIDARTQAVDPTTGLGAYQPFLTAAQTAATGATALTGPMTTAQTTAYMSPYQQQVIDATLTEFDRQKQIQQNQIAAQTLGVPGAFGGGREGVQRAEYDAASDRNRAAIQSNLLQQGFQQAQAARQQDFANQLGISQLQSGLGARAQDFSRAQISGLGTLGAQQQAQEQAVRDAQRQAAQMAVEDPRRRLSMLGQGVAGLSGLGSVQIAPAEVAPQTSPLTTALGLGLAGADIYGRIFNRKTT